MLVPKSKVLFSTSLGLLLIPPIHLSERIYFSGLGIIISAFCSASLRQPSPVVLKAWSIDSWGFPRPVTKFEKVNTIFIIRVKWYLSFLPCCHLHQWHKNNGGSKCWSSGTNQDNGTEGSRTCHCGIHYFKQKAFEFPKSLLHLKVEPPKELSCLQSPLLEQWGRLTLIFRDKKSPYHT